jgi:hypothetical protein
VITEKTIEQFLNKKRNTPRNRYRKAPKHHLPFIEQKKPNTQRSQINNAF